MSCQISHLVALLAATHAGMQGDHDVAALLVEAPRRRHGGGDGQAAVLDHLDRDNLTAVQERLVARRDAITGGTVRMPGITASHVERCIGQVAAALATN